MPADEFWDAADGCLVRAAGGFIGHVQRLDEPLGSYRKHGRNDSAVFATVGGLAEGLRKKIRWTQRELNDHAVFATVALTGTAQADPMAARCCVV